MLVDTYSPRELSDYTPTTDELALARRAGRSPTACLSFLVLLKTFFRVGYFVPLSTVPSQIVEQVAQSLNLQLPGDAFASYDNSGSRRRHVKVIREVTGISPYGTEARHAMVGSPQKTEKIVR